MRLMTWNLENLFLPTESGGPSQAAYESKLGTLATTINQSQVDMVAVQEVGNPEALADLVRHLDGVWNTTLSNNPDRRGIRVAWLSRFRVEQSSEVVDFLPGLQPVQQGDDYSTTARLGRGALGVTVDIGGTPLHAMTLHLKSKLLSYPGGRFQPKDEDERARYASYALFRRTAEAASIRHWVTHALDGHGKSRRLAVCGDFNDVPPAATNQIFLGPPGSEIGTGGFDQPDKGDGQRLWNTAPLMPPGKDYSRVTSGRKELLDQILVSGALVHKVTAVEALLSPPPPSIGQVPTARTNAPASDHAPVVADIAIGK